MPNATSVQAITGIPWYYRQFGYEMALNLGGGIGYRPHIPRLKDGETEPYRVRPVTAADLPCIAQLVEHANTRYRVACVRDTALWHYEAFGKREQNTTHAVMCLIDAADGESVGFWRIRRGCLARPKSPGCTNCSRVSPGRQSHPV